VSGEAAVVVEQPTNQSQIDSNSVFINCPFDLDYKPLMDAIILSTVACGFEPRTATDTSDVSRSRIDRITRAMGECRYSIHDLSLCTGAGEWNLARFNMPLELGMAMSLAHDWLVLVPSGHKYATFVSDLAGYDLKPHDKTTDAVIRAVISWLSTRRDDYTMTPPHVISKYDEFQQRITKVEIEWGDPPFELVLLAARASLELSSQVPSERP
jgi:hypothetical protein